MLKFSKEKPTQCGWYWLKDTYGFVCVVEIYIDSLNYSLNYMVDFPNGFLRKLDNVNGDMWAGPLELPEKENDDE